MLRTARDYVNGVVGRRLVLALTVQRGGALTTKSVPDPDSIREAKLERLQERLVMRREIIAVLTPNSRRLRASLF
jgi:hypothetical protein